MPTLVPVDHDPFAQGPALVPVDHDPFSSQKQPQMSGLRAFGRGAEESTSFGFTDELRGFGRAVGTKIRGDERPFPELLSRGISEIRNEYTQAKQQRPTATLTGEIAGGLAPLAMPGGGALAARIGSGNLPARVAKGAAAAAVPGAVYGFGSAEGDFSERLPSAGASALVSGALGGGLSAVTSPLVKGTKTASTGIVARGVDELDQTAFKIKQNASSLYKKSRDAGAIINRNRASNIINRMQKAVSDTGKINARLHGDTISVLDDLRGAQKSGEFGLEELDQYRQLLSDVVNKNTDAIKGMNPDAYKATKAIEALDDAVENLAPIDIKGGKIEAVDALNAGRAEWAKFRKFESVANIVRQANGDPNKLKSGFSRFVNKPKNLRGFTKEEVGALKAAGNNSMNEKILKGLGRFGIEPGNVYLPLVGGGLGALSGAGVPAAAIVGAGTVARQAQKFTARGKAEQALRAIESRQTSLPARATPKAIQSQKNLSLQMKRKVKP